MLGSMHGMVKRRIPSKQSLHAVTSTALVSKSVKTVVAPEPDASECPDAVMPSIADRPMHCMWQATCSFNRRYAVDETKELGRGTYGRVYQARCGDEGDVAVKVVNTSEEGLAASALNELRLLHDLQGGLNKSCHPNVVRLIDAVITHMEVRLVFEIAERSLHTAIKTMPSSRFVHLESSLSAELVCKWTSDIGAALCFVHERSIIHRDVTPSNLLLIPSVDRLVLKLGDFGLGCISQKPQPNDSDVTTLFYRAPEVLFGASSYTNKIDVWSYGCVLAEMALGYPIFRTSRHKTSLTTSEEKRFTMDAILNVVGYQVEPTRNAWGLEKWRHANLLPLGPRPSRLKDVLSATLSSKGVDLLGRILAFAPMVRMTAAEALGHSYIDWPLIRTFVH